MGAHRQLAKKGRGALVLEVDSEDVGLEFTDVVDDEFRPVPSPGDIPFVAAIGDQSTEA